MTEQAWVAILVPLAFLVGFPLFWIGISQFSSAVSGWRALAAKYPAPAQPTGTVISAPGSQVGFAHYRNVMTAHVSPEGLRLSVSRLFPGHAPLFIPWSDIHDIRPSKPLVGKPGVMFRVGSVSSRLAGAIYIPAAIFEHPDVPPEIRAVVSPQARTA